MKRITPRIVIEPMEITRCAQCPFFEDSCNDCGEHFYSCQKTPPWGDMPGFKDPWTIWEKCPLPIVED